MKREKGYNKKLFAIEFVGLITKLRFIPRKFETVVKSFVKMKTGLSKRAIMINLF